MNQLQAHQLAAALSTATTVFAPPTSPQGRLAASLLQSAQSGIINENQKKAKKDAEKKKKKGALGDLGGLLGSAVGGAIGGPAGAAIGGALGGAAGSGSLDPATMLAQGVAGYAMAPAKAATPAAGAVGASPVIGENISGRSDAFNLLNKTNGATQLATDPFGVGTKALTDSATNSPFRPTVDQVQAGQFRTALTPAAGLAANLPVGIRYQQQNEYAQKPQQFQTLIKSQAPELMQQPQPMGFFKRLGNNIRGQVQMRTNPTRFMLNQATDGIYDLTPMGAY